MRVEFYRDDPAKVVGTARWDSREAVLERAEDEATGHAILRMFRPTPVVADDAALRTLSGRGESVLEPGSLDWFREAALTRAPTIGLTPRFVPDMEPGEGYDPAAQYRKFGEQMSRFASGES